MAHAATLPILTAESGLTRYLEEIRRFPMLEPQEEYMLAKRWREHGDRDAAHRLVTSHLRLVAKIAMGYRGYGLPIAEVISEGNVGLMQAVKRFEPEKGFRLATYAMWWIKASIQEYILRSWSLVKMGTTANQKKLFFNLRKAKSKISALEEGDMRPDQVKLIAKRLGVTEQDVIDMNRRLGGDASLNAPIRDDGDSGEWQDWLVDDAPSAERVMVENEEFDNRRKALGEALTVLNDRERRIFEARRLAEDPITLEELADEFGVSRARAPDRGARVREGAESGDEPCRRRAGAGCARRCHGTSVSRIGSPHRGCHGLSHQRQVDRAGTRHRGIRRALRAPGHLVPQLDHAGRPAGADGRRRL
jgi:RNA polymerase sigma-32 factor